VLPNLIARFGWRNIGVLHVNDDYANAYARGMRDDSGAYGVTVVASADYTTNTPSTYPLACRSLSSADVNVIVVIAWDQDLPELLKVCKAEGLWGEGYVWLVADGAAVKGSFAAGADFGQSKQETAELLNGVLNFYASPEASSGYARFQSDWLKHNASYCPNELFNASEHPEIFSEEAWSVATYAYDCVVAFAVALSRATDPSNGVEVASHFRQVRFDGASGKVEFDSRGDREESSISFVLYNWVAEGASVKAHLAATISLSADLELTPGYNITWHESRFTPLDVLTLSRCPPGTVRDLSTGVQLCVTCPPDKIAHEGVECIPKSVTIGMIMPYTNADKQQPLPGSTWRQVICAGKLAVSHVNSRHEEIVPGLGAIVGNLSWLSDRVYDSGYTPTEAMLQYRQFSADGAVAMVGAARSAVSTPLATQGKIDQIPQCSFWSSSPALSDVLQFPFFGRTFPSDAVTTKVLPNLIARFGWRNIGVLHVNDDYANAYARGMRDDSGAYGVTVVASADYTTNTPSTYPLACRSLSSADVNVIVVIAWDQDLPELLKVCKAEGLWGEGYVWLVADGAAVKGSFAAGADFGQSKQETAELLNGVLNFYASPEASSGYARFQSDWLKHNASYCPNELFNASEHPEIFSEEAWSVATYAYDCVVAFAVALSRATDPSNGVEVASHFRQVRFDGASGKVEFDSRGDREESSISFVLYNWVAEGASVKAHLAATISLGTSLRPTPGYNITWAGSSQTVPFDKTLLPLTCPPGTGVAIVSGSPQCALCEANRYSDTTDGSDCKPCPPGSIQPRIGSTSCDPCGVGLYQAESGAPCVPCEERTSSREGSTVCEVCAPQYYIEKGEVPSSNNCKRCPVGASCGWNTTVETMIVLEGYWRLSPFSPSISKCASGDTPNATNATSCLGGNAGDETCASRTYGPMCQVCAQDAQYFSAGRCLDCPEAGPGVAKGTAILLSILILAAAGVFIHEQHSPSFDFIAVPLRLYVHQVKTYITQTGGVTKLKLTLAFVQVIAALESTYAVGLPESWFRWTETLRFVGNLDWASWLVPSKCLVGGGMKMQLLVRGLAPLVVIFAMPVVPLFISLCSVKCEGKPGARKSSRTMTNDKDKPLTRRQKVVEGLIKGLPASLVVSFCFTPSVSASIFRAWYCLSFAYDELEEHSFLAEDLSVRCDASDGEYGSIQTIAWVLVGIWPIGMVVAYALLLVPCHSLLHDETAESSLLDATAFLHRDYKTEYYWWEVISLMQRTTLTGWLLLLDVQLQFIRLLAALIISIAFLIAILACNPFKRRLDYCLAAGGQILFVCIFIGGIIVRLYEDIANDTVGSPELAYRFLGLQSSEEAVIIMICVSFTMLVFFTFTIIGETYVKLVQQRLESKFSVCTMNPPTTKWKLRGIYACFLSHYKMEAASDARYMHDILRKMLKSPVFLDSSTLNDLRNLITEGVHKSDTLVLLATKAVLTRPWCLLELIETFEIGIPVVLVQMANGGFTFEAARHFATNLEEEMKVLNPSGLALLHSKIGPNLDNLKQTVHKVLDANQSNPIVFDSHAGDSAMVATMKDVIERMAMLTNRKIKWSGGFLEPHKRKLQEAQKMGEELIATALSTGLTAKRCITKHLELEVTNTESAIFLCCSRRHSLKHARVLRSQLAVKIGRGCAIGGGQNSSSFINESELCLVLLSKPLLTDPSALFEIWLALQRQIPIVTVVLTGDGYSYEEASEVLANLQTEMENARPGSELELQKRLGGRSSVDELGAKVNSSLSAIIAVTWSPFGSRNQLEAVIDDIVARMPRKKVAKGTTRAASFSKSASRGRLRIVNASSMNKANERLSGSDQSFHNRRVDVIIDGRPGERSPERSRERMSERSLDRSVTSTSCS